MSCGCDIETSDVGDWYLLDLLLADGLELGGPHALVRLRIDPAFTDEIKNNTVIIINYTNTRSINHDTRSNRCNALFGA